MKQTDLILKNGMIYTMAREGDVVEALAVRDGKIVYTGTTEEVLGACEAPQVVDLAGKTMLPGMGDSHLHFFAYCQTHTTVDLGGCTSKAEAIGKLAARAAETPKGQWIKGSNFDESKWDADNDHLPTKADLDLVSPDHPVMMKRVCLHTAVANTAALAAAGIGKGYEFGPGGLVELDVGGMPNGILREQATKIFDELIPDPAKIPEVKEKIMREALAEASSQGLTTVHTYAADIWKYTEDPEDYLLLDRKGQLPLPCGDLSGYPLSEALPDPQGDGRPLSQGVLRRPQDLLRWLAGLPLRQAAGTVQRCVRYRWHPGPEPAGAERAHAQSL